MVTWSTVVHCCAGMKLEAREERLVVERESVATVAVNIGLHKPCKDGMPACTIGLQAGRLLVGLR